MFGLILLGDPAPASAYFIKPLAISSGIPILPYAKVVSHVDCILHILICSKIDNNIRVCMSDSERAFCKEIRQGVLVDTIP